MARRPIRLSPRHEQALRLIALGMSTQDAAELIGIGPERMSTIYRSPVGQSFVLALYAMANDYTARMLALGLTPRHLSSAQGGGDPARQAVTVARKERAAAKQRRREARLAHEGEGSEDPGRRGDDDG